MMSMSKTVELPGPVTLSYVEQGDPSGIPMLLLHGLTDSCRSFAPVLPHFDVAIPPTLAVSDVGRLHGGPADPLSSVCPVHRGSPRA